MFPRALLLMGIFWVGPALAQEPGLQLTWQAPAACPTKAAILRQIDVLVAAPEGEAEPLRPLGADAVVQQMRDGFRLDLVLRDGELVGRRSFSGASCAEVTGAAAVAIALLLRPPDAGDATAPHAMASSAAGANEGSAPEKTAANDDAALNDRDRATEGAPQRSERRTRPHERGVHFVVLLPLLDVGFQLLSQPSPGLGGGIGLEPGAWRIALTALWRPEIHLSVPDVAGISAKVDRVTTSLVGCYWFAPSRLELAPCLSAALQWMRAEGVGPGITPSPASATWVALGPAGLARLRVGPLFALTAKAGFEVQTARPVLVIDALATVEEVGPLEVNAAMGAEWIF